MYKFETVLEKAKRKKETEKVISRQDLKSLISNFHYKIANLHTRFKPK